MKRQEAELKAAKAEADYKALLACTMKSESGRSGCYHLQVWEQSPRVSQKKTRPDPVVFVSQYQYPNSQNQYVSVWSKFLNRD